MGAGWGAGGGEGTDKEPLYLLCPPTEAPKNTDYMPGPKYCYPKMVSNCTGKQL